MLSSLFRCILSIKYFSGIIFEIALAFFDRIRYNSIRYRGMAQLG